MGKFIISLSIFWRRSLCTYFSIYLLDELIYGKGVGENNKCGQWWRRMGVSRYANEPFLLSIYLPQSLSLSLSSSLHFPLSPFLSWWKGVEEMQLEGQADGKKDDPLREDLCKR